MINVAPFKQTDDSRCGPACIKMILNFWGIEATEDEICHKCQWSYDLGCTDIQMKAAIEAYGLYCEILNDSSLDDIKYWIDKNIPIIVDFFSPGINPDLGDMPNGHSSVVVDIDDKYIHLLDPELGGIRSILHDEFMRVFFDWRTHPTIQLCDDLILRQIIVVLPLTLNQIINIKQ